MAASIAAVMAIQRMRRERERHETQRLANERTRDLNLCLNQKCKHSAHEGYPCRVNGCGCVRYIKEIPVTDWELRK